MCSKLFLWLEVREGAQPASGFKVTPAARERRASRQPGLPAVIRCRPRCCRSWARARAAAHPRSPCAAAPAGGAAQPPSVPVAVGTGAGAGHT